MFKETLQTFFLITVIIYFLACFHVALLPNLPVWSWFGNFQMFTFKSNNHYKVTAFYQRDKKKSEIELDQLFSSNWESGPRYQRGSFRKSKYSMRVLAASTCKRLKVTNGQINIYQSSWRIEPGVHYSSNINSKKKLLISWDCKQKIKLVNGRYL